MPKNLNLLPLPLQGRNLKIFQSIAKGKVDEASRHVTLRHLIRTDPVIAVFGTDRSITLRTHEASITSTVHHVAAGRVEPGSSNVNNSNRYLIDRTNHGTGKLRKIGNFTPYIGFLITQI